MNIFIIDKNFNEYNNYKLNEDMNIYTGKDFNIAEIPYKDFYTEQIINHLFIKNCCFTYLKF